METCGEVFVGVDVAKMRKSIAVADVKRGGEVRYLGEIDAAPESRRRLVKRVATEHARLLFCYEAGPTGYGLYRLITDLSHSCMVVAPSLIPRKLGDRVKTNRRNALALAKLLREGELTTVWLPDEGYEAMRDVVRAHAGAFESQRVHRQQVRAFMLKHGRVYPPKKGGTMRYLRWLHEQRFEHPAHQIALQEMVGAVRIAKERVARIDAAIRRVRPELVSWTGREGPTDPARRRPDRGRNLRHRGRQRHPVREPASADGLPRFGAGQALGRRHRQARRDHHRREGAGPPPARRERLDLPASAPDQGGKLYRLEAAPPRVREIAWKAQTRRTARDRALRGRGKKATVVCTAIARELVGFMWSVARQTQTA